MAYQSTYITKLLNDSGNMLEHIQMLNQFCEVQPRKFPFY